MQPRNFAANKIVQTQGQRKQTGEDEGDGAVFRSVIDGNHILHDQVQGRRGFCFELGNGGEGFPIGL